MAYRLNRAVDPWDRTRPMARPVSTRRAVAPRGVAPLGAAGILALQRSAGNRAVTELMSRLERGDDRVDGDEAGRFGVPVQPKLRYRAEDIEKERSLFGRAKGARTEDTLWQIAQLLRQYQLEMNPETEQGQLRELIVLCKRYLNRHGEKLSKGKASVVDDLLQAADVELSKFKAQQKYLEDIGTPMAKIRNIRGEISTVNPTMPALLTQTPKQIAKDAADNPDIKKVMAESGVTLAELTAIQTFIWDDYAYANPSMANNDAWLDSVIEKRLVPTFSKKSPKNQQLIRNHIRQQGAIHNAMALSGIAKLPPKTGLLFRGAHMKRGAVPKAGDILNVATIQSWSPALKAAEEFTQRDKAEGEMSVLFRLNTTQARDINVFKINESEWVLLPGARYQVEEVTEDTPLQHYAGKRGVQVRCVELA